MSKVRGTIEFPVAAQVSVEGLGRIMTKLEDRLQAAVDSLVEDMVIDQELTEIKVEFDRELEPKRVGLDGRTQS